MKRKFTHSSFLLICAFAFLLYNKTNAQNVTVIPTAYTGLATSPLVPGATTQAVLGIQLDKAGGGANDLLQLIITCNQDPTVRVTSAALRRSNDADFSGGEPTVSNGVINGPSGSPANSIVFDPIGPATEIYDFGGGSGSATAYFFVVVTVQGSVAASTAPITFSLTGSSGITLSDNSPVASGSSSGSAYSFLGATLSSLNAGANNVAASPLIPGATGKAVYGFSLVSNGAQTVSSINVQLSSNPAGKLGTFSLVLSSDADFNTAGDNTIVPTTSIIATASEVQITPTAAINISTAKNLFLVANVNAGTNASTGPVQASLGTSNFTVNQGAKEGSATGTNYSFLGATIGSLNAGANNVALSPLIAGATGKAVFGFSLSSNGSQTVSVINIQLTSDPTTKLGSYLLVLSGDSDFGTTGDNTTVLSSMIGTPTEIQFTPSIAIDISSTKNLFLVADVNAGVTGATPAIQASLGATNFTVNQGGKGGSSTGTNYSFAAPVATIGSLNSGANNVAASPLTGASTGQAVFGFSLTSNTTQTVSAINVQLSSDPTAKLGSFSLVLSGDADFATTGDNSLVATSSIVVTATEVQITPTASINISSVKNLFLVANVDPTVTGASTAIQASLAAANFTVNLGTKAGSATGTNYSFQALTATIGSLNAGANNVAASPITGGDIGKAVFGFSLTSNGNQTVSGINVQLSSDPAAKLGSFSLVLSGDADFATTGDNSIVATSSITVTATEVQITPTTAINISSVKNLFLVANVDPSVTGASTAIQATLTTTDFTVNQGVKAGSATGTNYTFQALLATIGSLNAGANNVAASPITGGDIGKAVFGFSLSSNGSQTVSVINVQLSSNPVTKLGSFSLVLSGDADFATAGDNTVIPTSSIIVTASEIQITPTAPVNISTVKNLFLIANVDPTVTGASTPIQASLLPANLTIDQGTKAGSATGTDYSFQALVATIGSLNAGANNVALSPLTGGATGQAIFGFSLSSNGNQTVSTFSVQCSTNPSSKFTAYSLIQSVDADFATTGDNTTVAVASITASPTQIQVNPLTPLNIATLKNLFLVTTVDPTVSAVTPLIQGALAPINFTVNQGNKAGSATGTNYSFQGLTATIGSLNAPANNVAGSPLIAGATNQALFGFSLSSNGNQTVSVINVQLSSDPTGKLSGFSLVQSGDSDFATAGDNIAVPTSGFVVTASALQITLVTPDNISSVKNYFVVGNVAASVLSSTPAIQASLGSGNFLVDQGGKSGSASGINYSFNSSQATAITVNFIGQMSIDLGEYSNDEAILANLTNVNTQRIFAITIEDGDNDSHNTTITQLDFSIANPNNLATISLFDGATKIASQTVSGSTVSFSAPSLIVINDGATGTPVSRTIDVRVTFAPTVIDHETIDVALTNALTSAGSSGLATFAAIQTTAGRNPINVDDTEIRFANISPSISPVFNFTLTVQATDARGNVDADRTGAVTLSKDSGSGVFSSTDVGVFTRSLTAGQATWTQLQFSLADSYKVRAAHASFTDITIDLDVLSLGVLITGPSNQNFCFGGIFTTLTTLNFSERDPSDFSPGTNVSYSFSLPDGFVFNTTLLSITPTETGTNVSALTAITYPNSSTARFTYTVTGINSLDAIIIAGLQVKYIGTSAPTSTDIIRIGGSALQAKNNLDTTPPVSHGTVTASAASTTGYDFVVDEFSGQPAISPGETRFSISVSGVKLLPSSTNPVLPGSTFSGNGVSYSNSQASYIFSPASIGVGSYVVTLSVNDGSCLISKTKTFEVFATTITNLNSQYCSNSTPSSGLTVNQTTIDNELSFVGEPAGSWALYDFVYYNPTVFDYTPITPVNTVFDPSDAQYQNSLFQFGGVNVYYRIINNNPASPYYTSIFIWSGQFVTVDQAPNISLSLPSTIFCYNGASIDLDGIANPPPANSTTDTFTEDHPGPGGISSLGNDWTFTPAGVQGANTASQTFNITYQYKNPSTQCTNSVTKSITVHPNPLAVTGGEVTSGTTLLVCKDGLSNNFTATNVPGVSYNWYNPSQTSILRTGDVFNPNTSFDETTVASTNFYVSKTENGCESIAPHLQLTVTVNGLPTVNAGPPSTSICSGNDVNLTALGASFGGTATSATWTAISASPGQFLNASDVVVPMPAPLGAAVKYIPSSTDISSGTVTLRLTTNDPSGPCVAEFDDILILINSVAQANAGTNQLVCSGAAIQLNGTIGGAANSQTWYKTSIAPANILGTSLSIQYLPTVTELQTGANIDFILVTDDPPGLCPAVNSSVNVIINQRPTVDAGPVVTVCSGTAINLDGAFGAAASSVTWSGGAGLFANNALADTQYLPSATELASGATLTLTLTTDDPTGPCIAESDVVQVTINPIPNAPLAVSPSPYCINDPIASLKANGTNLKWYDDVLLTNQVSAGATFASGVQSNAEKVVSFYVTQTLLNCESPSSVVTITINAIPAPDFSATNYCLGQGMEFTDASSVNNGTIAKWGWRFDDGDDLQSDTGVIPAGTHNSRTSGSFSSPVHTYGSMGSYNVRVIVESDKGCVNSLIKNYKVGPVPKANFTHRNVCEDDVTLFTYQDNNPVQGQITTWEWNFADPNSGVNNISAIDNPSHQFTGTGSSSKGTYSVTLRLVTILGCESTIVKNVSILPYIKSFPYIESFEQNGHGWVTEGLNFNQFNSWQLNTPNGQVINSASNGTKAWFTRVDNFGTYNNNERSVLYGPCLNLTQIDRPVLSLQYWNNTDLGNDGTYIETSDDGGQTWRILGGLNQGGLNWYNRGAILGLAQQNGIGQPIGQIGWTGDSKDAIEQNGWTSAKLNLDNFRTETKLRLRIVFGSNGDNPTDRPLDGFAFDDFRIEQRNRTILAENFTNMSAAGATTNNSQFRNFQNTVTSNELVKIQYHTSIGGNDALHDDNAIDPNARAAFYGVTSSFKGYVDGSGNGDFTTLNWASNEYNSRTLVSSPIDISVSTTSDASGLFTVQSTINILSSLPQNRQYIIQTAIVEKQVGTEEFVLRKFLPSAAGVPLTALLTNTQQTETLSTMLSNIQNPNEIAVIVFVQELQAPKEVMQATLLDNIPPPTIVTGLENLSVEHASIFPNPANNEFTIQLLEPVKNRVSLLLYDAFGHTVNESAFQPGESKKVINTSDLASGIYVVHIDNKNKSLIRKKVMVVHTTK